MKRSSYDLLRPARLGFAAMATLVLVASACSKDKDPTQPPPPPPVRRVAAINVTPATATIDVGATASFTATAVDSVGAAISGTVITFYSSDTTIATVDASGLATGKGAGSVIITASAGNSIVGISGAAALTVNAIVPPPPTTFDHVFVVGLLEKNYETIFPLVGASPMPFLDSLANTGGRATQFYGNAHPSIGNFYMMLAGDTVTTDDNDTTTYSGDNLIRQVIAAGKTWKSYAQSIPGRGYLGSDLGLYIRHHNVPVLLSDVRSSAAQQANIVPLSQLATDISGNTLPNFGLIIPDECNNSHTCPLSTVDSFLRTTLTPLISSAAFQNSLLVILFDRSATSSANGGGRVAMVVVSPRAKAGFTSSAVLQHQSILRLSLSALGINTLPGAAATAPEMKDFFATPW